MTATELIKWDQYFRAKLKNRDKMEYYLGRLTYLCAKFFGADMDESEILIDWKSGDKKSEKIAPRDLAMALGAAFGAEIVEV